MYYRPESEIRESPMKIVMSICIECDESVKKEDAAMFPHGVLVCNTCQKELYDPLNPGQQYERAMRRHSEKIAS